MMEYVAPGKVKVAWRGKLHADPTNSDGVPDKLFISGSWSELDERTKSYEWRLEVFRAPLRNPAPDRGWNFQDNMQNLSNSWSAPRPWVRMRMVLFGLTQAAVGDLHHGDLKGAVKNLNAVINLAQFDRNEPVLLAPMIRASVIQVGVGLTWQTLQMTGWEEPELKSLQNDWQKVDLLGGVERGIQGERAQGIIIAEEIRHTPIRKMHDFFGTTTFAGSRTSAKASLADFWDERMVPLLYKLTSINEDESLQFRQTTAGLDSVRMLAANRPWPEVSAILSNRTAEFESKLGRSHFHRYFVSRLTVPKYAPALQKIATVETERRLAITAIAIKRYELKNQKSPLDLAALVPEFLAAVPIDPMSGKPFCYRLKNDGGYVLYSVGTDGKDDGGDATASKSADLPGLWAGRDAVWPSAASDEEVAKEEAEAAKKPE
jgi:hypothetical protein